MRLQSKINVDNDHKNNHSVFEYFNDKSWLSGPLKSMVISFTQNWDSEISQKFTNRFNYSKAIKIENVFRNLECGIIKEFL